MMSYPNHWSSGFGQPLEMHVNLGDLCLTSRPPSISIGLMESSREYLWKITSALQHSEHNMFGVLSTAAINNCDLLIFRRRETVSDDTVLFLGSHLSTYVPECLSVSGDRITDWLPFLVNKTNYQQKHAAKGYRDSVRLAQAVTYIVWTTSEPLRKRQRAYSDVRSSEMVRLVPVHKLKLTWPAEPKLSSGTRQVPWEKKRKTVRNEAIQEK